MSAPYDPKLREAYWQKQWEEKGIYHFQDDQPRERTFVLDTPPPTVSGVLHMGHIFSYTQADFMARYKRMRGFDVFYPMGFDDNGLPTERLVEKVKGVRALAMANEENGREKFVNLCREVVKDAELEFKKLFQSVALSVDWNQLYQTISDEVTALSQASFLDLIEKGEAYRDFRPTYWDWVDQTAIASAEIEEKELPGIQITIPFGIMDASEWQKYAADASLNRPDFSALAQVPVMTTRPELLGACVALMCHPDNEATFAGKVAVSPLFNVVVPICFDEKVDKEKGTGFVMCCSWGDDTDKEWIQTHGLTWRTLIKPDGKIGLAANQTEDAINFYVYRLNERGASSLTSQNCLNIGLAKEVYSKLEGTKLIRDIKNENSAKGRAVKLLEEAGLLRPQGEKQELVIHKAQMVKCAERSGSPIEIIPTSQWFIKIVDKKEAIKEKAAQCEWKPDYMRIRLNQWADGLREDWCISRQRFFGVPFPVWYSKRTGEEGKALYAKVHQLPIDPFVDLPEGYTRDEVVADKDVMDTWATSSISPQINAGAVGNYVSRGQNAPQRAQKLFPVDVRPQAHEIIRTWAFYTIVKAHLHSDSIPWKNLMISGWCLAADKTKMSKSKGNVVTPVALIEDKGADAVRYWASTSRLGADTAFSEDLLKIGKKLVNKLFNAANFVGQMPKPEAGAKATEMLDQWILSRLHETIAEATTCFENYEYADARASVERFFWRDFCDNYLELVKARAYGGEGAESARYALNICLNTILKLFAPIVPHICEELFEVHFAEEFASRGSIHARGSWPELVNENIYSGNEMIVGEAAIEILEIVRKAKSEANVSIKFPVKKLTIAKNENFVLELNSLDAVMPDVKAAGNVEAIEFSSAKIADGTTTMHGNFTVKIELNI